MIQEGNRYLSIDRKMAGNNSTLSVKIIKTKSLRKQKNSLKKKIIQS